MLEQKEVRLIGLSEFATIIHQRIRNRKPAQLVEGYEFTPIGFDDGRYLFFMIVLYAMMTPIVVLTTCVTHLQVIESLCTMLGNYMMPHLKCIVR